MTLGDKQREFTHMLGQLISYAYSIGYELTLGRGAVTEAANKADGGHKRSLHLSKLAQDFNLFIAGNFIVDGTAHDILHDYWDKLGGSKRIAKDLNHYSYEHNGMR